MSIGRTLTKKASRASGFNAPPDNKRASFTKKQISAPIALISTTNMMSYTSPSLCTSQSYGSISSGSAPSSSSTSPTSSKFPSSVSSVEDLDQTTQDSLKPSNHLSMSFTPPAPTPALVPTRSLSEKSANRASAPTHRRAPSTPAAPLPRSNSTGGRPMPPKQLHSAINLPRGSLAHPFGAELAKVAEMTEEIGVGARDAEEEFMISHGLQKFQAQDYAAEIGNVFGDILLEFHACWI